MTCSSRPGVHVLLDRDADPLGTLLPSRFVSIHRLANSPGNGLIAVRPDGYIGFRGQTTEIGQLAAWLARLAVTRGPADSDLSSHLPGRQMCRTHRRRPARLPRPLTGDDPSA